MLHPCAEATHLSYFEGSKAGFSLFILLLFLFPAGEWQRRPEPEKPPAFNLLPSQLASWWPPWWPTTASTGTATSRGRAKLETGQWLVCDGCGRCCFKNGVHVY